METGAAPRTAPRAATPAKWNARHGQFDVGRDTKTD
jgi:hypothetical protein